MDFDGAIGPGTFAGRRKPGFVADPHALVAPVPGDKGTFSKLGKNLFFEASPAVVHFGGFTLNRVHEQSIKVSLRPLCAAACVPAPSSPVSC